MSAGAFKREEVRKGADQAKYNAQQFQSAQFEDLL